MGTILGVLNFLLWELNKYTNGLGRLNTGLEFALKVLPTMACRYIDTPRLRFHNIETFEDFHYIKDTYAEGLLECEAINVYLIVALVIGTSQRKMSYTNSLERI